MRGFRHALRGAVSGHRILPRTTPPSIGHESQIKPWLAVANPLLAGAKEAEPNNAMKMTPRTSHGSEKENHALQKVLELPTGLDVRKSSFPDGSEEVFLLDIPFYRTRQRVNTKQAAFL
jgi:hypothetical protein